MKKYKQTEKNSIDFGIKIPISLKIILLNPASKYCKIEVWPNLKCKFASPNEILFSLSTLMYGKWYKPPSGLLTLSKLIKKTKNTEKIKEIINISNINFLFRKKIYIKGIIKIKVFMYLFKLIKKFKIKNKLDKKIIDTIYSIILFELKFLNNFVRIKLPKIIK